MKSETYKNDIQSKLQDVIDNLDDYYYNTKYELENEILGRKEQLQKIDDETKKVYNHLSNDLCEKLIRKKLPLKIKLFNEIHCCGKGIIGNGFINIVFYFNSNFNCFSYDFRISEIKKLLKIGEC